RARSWPGFHRPANRPRHVAPLAGAAGQSSLGQPGRPSAVRLHRTPPPGRPSHDERSEFRVRMVLRWLDSRGDQLCEEPDPMSGPPDKLLGTRAMRVAHVVTGLDNPAAGTSYSVLRLAAGL